MFRYVRKGLIAGVLAIVATLALSEASPAKAQLMRAGYSGFTPAAGYPGSTYLPPPSYPGHTYLPPPTYFGNGPYGVGYYTKTYAPIWHGGYSWRTPYMPMREPERSSTSTSIESNPYAPKR